MAICQVMVLAMVIKKNLTTMTQNIKDSFGFNENDFSLDD